MKIKYTHEINTAHRLLGHKGKCCRIHGHNYKITFTVKSNLLNDLGMVTDFGTIKTTLGGWLDDYWDHRFLIYDQDFILKALTIEAGEDIGVLFVPFNPTAENMAGYLLDVVTRNMFKTAEVVAVEVEETPGCSAIAKR